MLKEISDARIERCKQCEYSHKFVSVSKEVSWLECSKQYFKWVVEIERCPLDKGERS